MKIKTSILAFFTFIVTLCLLSCNFDKGKISKDVQIIDGCEYIVSKNSSGNIVSHKGNCNNPIHEKAIHDTIYVIMDK